MHQSQQRAVECEQSQEQVCGSTTLSSESQSGESVITETQLVVLENQLVHSPTHSPTASPTASIRPGSDLPITLSSGTRRGRKRRAGIVDSNTITVANKAQRGLGDGASVSQKRSVLAPISKNISSLVLKNHSKEIRNDRRDRRKRSLTLKARYSGIWEV